MYNQSQYQNQSYHSSQYSNPNQYQYDQEDQNECNYSDDIEQYKSGRARVRPVYPCKRVRTMAMVMGKGKGKGNMGGFGRIHGEETWREETELSKSASARKLKIIKRPMPNSNQVEQTLRQKTERDEINSVISQRQLPIQLTKSQHNPPQTIPQQIPQQIQQQPTQASQIPPPVDLNKIISQVMLQNNQHFHRVNESVVNRLLTIIENNQEIAMTNMSMSMKNSRWSSTNGRASGVVYAEQSAAKLGRKHMGAGHENEDNIDTNYNSNQTNSPKESQSAPKFSHQQPSYEPCYPNPTITPNSTITINNIIPSSTKSQPNTPHLHLSSSIKNKEIEIKELQNRRKKRSREFNYRTPRVHDMEETGGYQTPADTPRGYCESSVGRFGERKSMQCDQILQTPYQNQREDCNDYNIDPMNMNNRPMHKSNKIQQIEISCSTVQVCPNSKQQPPIQSRTVPLITSHAIIQKHQQQQITTEPSIQLPVSNDQKGGHQKTTSIEEHLVQSSMMYKKPVFMEIPTDGGEGNQFGAMSLAEAFKKRIGKLPSRAERRQQLQAQKQNQPIRPKDTNIQPQFRRISKQKSRKQKGTSLQVDVRSLKKGTEQSLMTTPKSCQPSEQLLNRLIGGSKAKVSKKQMYALTRKNYQNLPEVQQKKKKQQKKLLEQQRMERIKQYQKNIRASKTTIASNN